jgi:hypothetical protein
MEVVNPAAAMAAPVYYPARAGVELLAAHDDEKWLLTSTRLPQWQHLAHFVAISDLHITADQSVARQAYVTLTDWANEYDVLNKEATAPAERFRLYTLIQQSPKLVCVPDCAFVLEVKGHRKAFYVELERATSAPSKVAAEKTPGYAALHQRQLHKKHFPGVLDDFTVLVTAPDARWRDALRRAFRGKPGIELYRFAATTELTPETFLFGSVWYPCVGEAVPLVKPPAATARGTP